MDKFIITEPKPKESGISSIPPSSGNTDVEVNIDLTTATKSQTECQASPNPSSSSLDLESVEGKSGVVERTETITDSEDKIIRSDSADEEDEKSQKNENKKKKIYEQKFKESWTTNFPWLEMKERQAFCKACLKIINGGKSHLQRHEKTTFHQSRIKSTKKTVALPTLLETERHQEQSSLLKSGELKLTMFLQEHNLAFLLMDHLPQLVSSVCPDSKVAKGIKCARTKAASLTRDCLAAQQIANVSSKLRSSAFSIIIDETTDVSSDKSLAIVARFYDEDERRCKDEFIGLIKVTTCTAEALFNAICTHLKELEIPLSNVLGLAADNASVMMGNITGVKARFKRLIPNIFVLGCVCHSIHLCSSTAARKLLRSLEELVRSVYKYFAHSSVRLAAFKECQMFLDFKPHKLLRPSQTRWLSLQAAVDRMVENWEALILFFTSECFEVDLLSTQTILGQLKSPIFKVYFNFLSYVLDLVNKFNVEFQAEKPKIYLLLSRVRSLYRTILRNYIEINHLDSVALENINPSDSENFIPHKRVYYGAKADILLSNENINPEDISNFRARALDFYVALAEQIKNRFNFDEPVLLFVSNFNPMIALSGNVANIGTEALRLFPQLIDDIEGLNTEWRLLPDLPELKTLHAGAIEDFWSNIFHMKNAMGTIMFPNLTRLVKGLLCLPHSSAAAERVFSQLNLLKTKTRNRLEVGTCENILHAKALLANNTCCTWQPSAELLKRKPKYENVQKQ